MTVDQLPDSLQLRNLFRSLATLDLLVAPAAPTIQYTADPDTRTYAAILPIDDRTTCTAFFNPEGATLTFTGAEAADPLTVASTLDQPTWLASPGATLPNLFNGAAETAQEWLAMRYSVRPDLTPIRQILEVVPLTANLARDLGNTRPWSEIRDAVTRIGYPIPEEYLPGPDNPNSGVNLG